MFKSLCLRTFSLSKKIPKQLPPPESSFLSSIFHRSKSSQTYPPLQQLFQYLQSTPLIKQYFPFLKSSPRLESNLMMAHCVLLFCRLKQDLPPNQLPAYHHNLKSYFFLPYAQFAQKKSSVGDIDYHFVDAYQKKYGLIEREIGMAEAEYINGKHQLQNYKKCFGEVVYQRKVGQEDQELVRLSKYYLAHVRYLQSLSIEDMKKYKVQWGLKGKPDIIEQFVKDTK